MKIETVRVVHPDLAGGVLINRSDFDPKVHAIWVGAETVPKPNGRTLTAHEIVALETMDELRTYAEANGLKLHPRATNIEKAREKLLEQIAAKE